MRPSQHAGILGRMDDALRCGDCGGWETPPGVSADADLCRPCGGTGRRECEGCRELATGIINGQALCDGCAAEEVRS